MAVRRKDVEGRLTLYRICHICGKAFSTTADTPFIRQIANVDGKKQKICYFCSETCKKASYKHFFDGKANERKVEWDKERQKQRTKTDAYRVYQREYQRKWREKHLEDCREAVRYNRRKHKLLGDTL